MISAAFRVLLGAALLAAVVLLGLKTIAPHPSAALVALFGLASAILSPVGLSLIGKAFSIKKEQALEQLAKAGMVQEQVAKAETIEQKVTALKEEERRLGQIVRLEARRQVLSLRHERLSSEIFELAEKIPRMLDELDLISSESELLGQELENTHIHSEVLALEKQMGARLELKTRRPLSTKLPFIGILPSSGLMVDIADDLIRIFSRWLEVRRTKQLVRSVERHKARQGDGKAS
jgi:2C-methyl-D-erythritol 2,4-cyclodiphosphate synthase